MKAMCTRLVPILTIVLPLLGPGCKNEVPTQTRVTPEAAAGSPRLVIGQPVLDAGDVDYAVPREFAFRIRNTGTGPLHLVLWKRSCSCGDVNVPAQDIPPGREESVKLLWKPIPGKTGPYTFAVELQTNDPQMPTVRLEVKGRVNPAVRLLPDDWSIIDFNLIKPGQDATRELRLISSKLSSFDLEVQTSHAGLKPTVTKLAPEAGGEFKCGYAVLLQTTAGLPTGYLRESVTLKVRVPGESPREIVMHVYAEVENGVFQAMPREVEFRKPKVMEEDSQRVRVQFFVPSDQESVEVVRCEPSFLTCDPPARLRPGLWEFIVRLPAGNAAAAKHQADGFFEGRLILRTSGSRDPVPVRVKWAPPEG